MLLLLMLPTEVPAAWETESDLRSDGRVCEPMSNKNSNIYPPAADLKLESSSLPVVR